MADTPEPREFPIVVTVGRTRVTVTLILKSGTDVEVKEVRTEKENAPGGDQTTRRAPLR